MEAIWIVHFGTTGIGAPVAAFKSRKDAESQADILRKNEKGSFSVIESTLIYNVHEAGYFNTTQEAVDARRIRG